MNYSMNGAEQENTRMYIINPRADLSPPPAQRNVSYRGVPKPHSEVRKTRKPAPKVLKRHSVPGASHLVNRNTWRAYYYDGTTTNWLGEHKSPERALMAVKLYKLWLKRKHSDIPVKPSFRLYGSR